MDTHFNKNNHGFTLIETMIYLALFGIVIGGGMIAAYQIVEGTSASQGHTVLQEEANFLLRKINWVITGATSVTANGGPTLIVIKDGNSLAFSGSGTDMALNSIVLNSSHVAVSDVTFTKSIGQNGMPDFVVSSFTLATAQAGRPATQIFSFTKYLRQ